jgi:formamidopyrimidine-DNA glycosylase
VQKPAQGAETGFAQVKFGRPRGGKAGISKFAYACCRNLKAGLHDQVAERLDVPGVKVVIGFGGTELFVLTLVLERHIKQQPSCGLEQPPDFFQNIWRMQDVFQCVMANHHVRDPVWQNFRVGDELNTQRAQRSLQKIRHVKADFPTATQGGQIPAAADAVLQHHVVRAHQRRELARPERGHPRNGLLREAAFQILVTPPRVAAIMALGLLGQHEPQCRAARLIAQSLLRANRMSVARTGRGLYIPAMPELAEVEFYRKQWQCGWKQKILAVDLHPPARILRGVDTKALRKTLAGSVLLSSEAHGKQMFFRFSRNGWLGLHLGMTGKLRVEPSDFVAGRHDHLVLRQRRQSLVFSDPRQFGRVRFHAGETTPPWRADLPASILSSKFNRVAMQRFLQRHGRMALKAVLLMQDGFPGVGNWMADEILWRAKIHPARPSSEVDAAEAKKLFREVRFVCREALRTVGADFGDPPASWLFHRRWRKGGACPRDGSTLLRAQIGGRTTCWCGSCQK